MVLVPVSDALPIHLACSPRRKRRLALGFAQVPWRYMMDAISSDQRAWSLLRGHCFRTLVVIKTMRLAFAGGCGAEATLTLLQPGQRGSQSASVSGLWMALVDAAFRQ